METENNRKTRLQKLSGSDFEIVDGESDIRGWDVKDSSGNQLGEVEELIFDYASRKVRYLIVELDKRESNKEDRKVLVPIGIAELHGSDDDVILPGVTTDQLYSLPEYDEDRFDTGDEGSIRNVFGGLGTSALNGGSDNDGDFYNHGHFDESNLYRNRTRGNTSNDNANTDPSDDESISEVPEVNPGGVRLRSRSTEGINDTDPADSKNSDKNDEAEGFRVI